MLSALTISEAHDKLHKREISAVELMRSCINRIESVDKTLNVVVFQNFESALLQAKKIDEQGMSDHPLSGIPYLAKDVYCEAGVQTTACSNILKNKNYCPPFDSTMTARLKAAGAISIGKSNTDEFTMGGSTESSCYGPTRNPWDTTRVAGGSSGGSAAGVAADECVFAIGTDTGGSIRQPAGFCGITGMRTTYGRNSRYGAMSMASSLDTTGALTKTVEDTAIVLQATAGKDPLDATTSDVPVPDYRKALKKDVKGLKIGLPKEYFIEGIHPEIDTSVREAAKVLQSLGAIVSEISLPYTKYGVATYYILCPCEVSSNMARYDGIRFGHTPHQSLRSGAGQAVKDPEDLIEYYFRTRSEGFGAEVKRRIMIGTYALSAGYYDAYYRQAQKVRSLIKKDFEDAFEKVDVILSPVAPNPPWVVNAYSGDPVSMYLEDAFTVPQVMAGIPAISVPCGFTKPQAGTPALPIGLQIMGPQWGEKVVLRAAYAFEQGTEWHSKKPSL